MRSPTVHRTRNRLKRYRAHFGETGRAFLISAGLLFLVSARAPTVGEFLGLSGTFWFTVLSLVAAVTILQSVPEQNLISGEYKRHWQILFAFFGLASVGFMLLRATLNPTWDGFQMVVSWASFVLIVLALSRDSSILEVSVPFKNYWFFIVGGLATTIFFLAGIEFDFLHRARGQTFAIAAAAVPLFTNRLLIGIPAVLLLTVSSVSSDSRFATFTILIITPLVMLALTPSWTNRIRGIVAVTICVTNCALAWLSSALLSTRSILPALDELKLSALTAEAQSPTSWTTGRIAIWQNLIADLDSPRKWLWGLGQGYSSIETQRSFEISHPHNEYLRFLVDGGVISFILWIACLVTLALHILGNSSRFDKGNWWTAIALFVLLGSHSLVTNTLISPHFFVPLGVFLGIALRSEKASNYRRARTV